MSQAKRGELWLVDLGGSRQDHEQSGRRPAVIFQTDELNRLGTVVVIPLTTQMKRAGFASTVQIGANEGGQERESVALCHQIRAVDRRKLISRIGELPPERVSEIELAVLFVTGIPE